MATKTFKPIFGKRIRVSQVNPSGAPIAGPAGKNVSTDGFVTLTISAEIEEGTEILQKNASGNLCVNEKNSDSLKFLGLEMEFCGVNPSLLAIMTNAEEYVNAAGDVIGFTVPEGDLEKYFALELFTGLSGYVNDEGDSYSSGYFLLPFVAAGVLSEITVDGENAVTFTMSGARTKGGNAWGFGPYEITGTGAGLPTALDPFDHLLIMLTGAPVPAVSEEPEDTPAVLTTGTPTGV